MSKKTVIAGLVVFVAWAVMDFWVHGVVLKPSYIETKELWREQMSVTVMYMTQFCVALVFAHMYAMLVRPKGMKSAVEFGLWFGIATGISMGYGSYAVMPIPPRMAFLWFVSTALAGVVAGLVAGAIIREEPKQEAPESADAGPEPEPKPEEEPDEEPGSDTSTEEEAGGETEAGQDSE